MKKGESKLQVRFEILNLLFRNPQESIKIPSARELADKFDLARCTVALELKKLAEEGYLIGKRGSGTYTNPKQMEDCKYLSRKRIVGLMLGDSRRFYLGYPAWAMQSYFGLNICLTIGFPRILTLTSPGNPELSLKEIESAGVDALVWMYPDEQLKSNRILERLHRKGMPVLSVCGAPGKFPCITIDFEDAGRKIAAFLLEENRTRIVWDYAERDPLTAIQFKAAQACFREQGKTMDCHWNNADLPEFFAELELRCAAGDVPDAVICHGEHLTAIRGILRKCGVDERKQCRLIADFSDLPENPGFFGHVVKEPAEEIARVGTAMLQAAFRGETELREVQIPMQITRNHQERRTEAEVLGRKCWGPKTGSQTQY